MNNTSFDLTELAEHADCGLIIFSNDSKTSLIYANPYYFTLFGYSIDEYIDQFGFNFSPCIHKEDNQKFKSIMARQYAMGNTLHFEFRAYRKNGSLVWILLRGRLHHNGDSTSYYYCSCLDITDIKLSYNSLAKAKLELDIIADSLTGGIVKIRTSDYKLMYANNGFYKLSGISRTDYEEKFDNICTAVLYPEDYPMVRRKFKEAAKNHTMISMEYRIRHVSGQLRWSYLNGRQIDETDGSPVFLCVIVDITQLKRYEEQLTEIQRKQKLLCDYTNEINWEYDISSDILFRTGNTELTYSEMTEIHDFENTLLSIDAVHPDDMQKFRQLASFMHEGQTFLNQYLRLKNNIGNYIWYLLQGVTMYRESGKPYRIIGKTMSIHYENAISDFHHPEYTKDVMSEFMNRIEMAAYINEILENQDGQNPCALCIITLETEGMALEGYESFLSNTVINEIAVKINDFFPLAQKSYFGQGEFIIFSTEYDPSSDIPAKKRELYNHLSNTYIVQSGTAQVSIGYDLSKVTDHTFGQLYDRTCGNRENSKDMEADTKPDDSFAGPCGSSLSEYSVLTGSKSSYNNCREMQFIREIMDLLDDAVNSPSSLRLALSRICAYYDADEVNIVENTIDNLFSVVTYSWQVPGSQTSSEPMQTFPYELVSSYESLFNKDHIYVANDFKGIKEVCPAIYRSFEKSTIKSIFQCAFYEEDTYFGMLALYDRSNFRTFSPCEINYFRVLARLIESVLVRIRQKERITNSQYHDPVTGLLNFPQFIEETNKWIKSEDHLALLYIDINGFKDYNAKYGYSMGNKILYFVAQMLRLNLETDELCSRINGDQFIVLMQYKDIDTLHKRMAAMNDRLKKQRQGMESCYCINLSIGIYLLKENDTDVTNVIDKANYARKSVKTMTGACNYTIYSLDMDKKNNQELSLVTALAAAFKNKEFIPYYQPKYKVATEELCGAEALARWPRPGMGLLYPKDFIYLLEESSNIVELDFIMIEEVCQKLNHWMRYDKPIIPIAINLSGAHLNTADFVDRLTSIMARYHIPVKYLVLEFTERLFIKEPEPLAFLLDELSKLGFSLTLDDFGDEYSSLNLLKRFRINSIKLNTGFFHDRIDSHKNKIIFSKIVEMAKELGITVHAQNVETSFQAEFLKAIGCDVAQGYLYHKAMPADEFEKYIL